MQQKKLNVVFFGTPDFAGPSLKSLIKHHNVKLVITQPDKPVGRKLIITPPPIKKIALENNIFCLQPKTLKGDSEKTTEIIQKINNTEPDLAVVIAYGKKLPTKILNLPKFGSINLHASLLPKLRGASPIQSTILNGDKKTGLSIMLMDEGIDTGPIISQKELVLDNTETAETLHDKLSTIGADFLIKTIPEYTAENVVPKKQNDQKSSTCHIIKKEDGLINWDKAAIEINRMIRAFSPWPGAYTFCPKKNLRIKITQTKIENGNLKILKVQVAGKKEISYTDFLKGYPDCILPTI